MLEDVGMRIGVEMACRTVAVGFGNVLVRLIVVMHMQPSRLLKSRQHGNAQNYSERRSHVPRSLHASPAGF